MAYPEVPKNAKKCKICKQLSLLCETMTYFTNYILLVVTFWDEFTDQEPTYIKFVMLM